MSQACRIRKNQGGAKAKEEISRCTSSARQIFFLLGLVWIYIFRIFPSFFLGRIVVADRWFYDELIHCRYRSMCSFPELYLRLIPRPALLFYLKEEPKTAFSRAKEQDSGYFERKKRLYDRLAKKEHADIIAVEGIDKTAKKVRSKIDAAAKGLFW